MLFGCGCLFSSDFIRVWWTHPSYGTVADDHNEDEKEHKTSMTDEMSLKLTSHYPPAIGIFTNIYYYIWKPKIHTQNLYIWSEFIIPLASLIDCLWIRPMSFILEYTCWVDSFIFLCIKCIPSPCPWISVLYLCQLEQ